MKAWWRVIRGVYPYRWAVVLSMICAIGVGLSYASGVAVVLPVMKIFISAEQLQGWAHRVSAQSRLDLTFWDLDTNIRHEKEPNDKKGLRVTDVGKHAAPFFRESAKDDQVSIMSVTVNGQNADKDNWKGMVDLLAHAKTGDVAHLLVDTSNKKPNQVDVPLGAPSFYATALVWTADFLPENSGHAIACMILFFIFLCIVGSAFRYFQQYLGMSVANRVIMDLRRRTYDRIVQLPTSYFAQKGTADLMSRLTHDTHTLTDGVAMAFGKAVQEPIKALGALAVAFYLDWLLTLMILLTVPILAIIIRKFSKRMRRASRKALESGAIMLGIINETLIGARVVKAYSAEGYERRRFARINKQLLMEQNKLIHYNAFSRPVVETVIVILTSIPLLLAVDWVLKGNIDREVFFTLLALFTAMLEPMRKLADVNAKVQQSNAAAIRVFTILDLPPEPNISNALPKLRRHQRSIEFRDIIFSYPGHEEVVLNGISFSVKAGQNVAVVGGNGSGKTTLLQLLPRLYIPTSGQIFIDGVDAGTVSLRSLRKQIGLVTQDTLLFADTIYNNIAYGTRHATRDQVINASKRAFADEFITGFPEGYETRVGEHGVRLSGGQKQRIAIARAILRDPAILILDEAMSQIDSDSEVKITDALRAFTLNRTTFMIAHRFQSVISADLIVCLDKGEIAGLGTHNQLIESCLPYRKLYENQFREAV